MAAHTDRAAVRLTAVAVVLCTILPACLAQGNSVTLAAAECRGVTFNAVGESYNYTAELDTIILPPGCNEANVGVTKMYVQHACAADRNNSWFANQFGCVPVTDGSLATCKNVFATGPKDALLTAGLFNAPNVFNKTYFEQDTVTCFDTPAAYFFVYNNCTAPLTIGFDLIIHQDLKSPCYIGALESPGLIVEQTAPKKGGGLSTGAKWGIAIGVILGVALIVGGLLWFFCLV